MSAERGFVAQSLGFGSTFWRSGFGVRFVAIGFGFVVESGGTTAG